jgi:formylmethanofuran dehydrogenase subunit E
MMNRTQTFADVIRFHRHECPGAAFGLRVAEAALDRLGPGAPPPGLVLISETDTCAVDALQVMTGCTYGRRTLVHEDNGRNVFTFVNPGSGTGLRVRARAGSVVFRSPQSWQLADRIERGTATPDDHARFDALQAERTAMLLAAPEEEILRIDQVRCEAPGRRRLAPVDACQQCGEPTSVETLHEHRGRMVCPPCHLAAHGGVLPPDHAGHGHHPQSHRHHHQHGHAGQAGQR